MKTTVWMLSASGTKDRKTSVQSSSRCSAELQKQQARPSSLVRASFSSQVKALWPICRHLPHLDRVGQLKAQCEAPQNLHAEAEQLADVCPLRPHSKHMLVGSVAEGKYLRSCFTVVSSVGPTALCDWPAPLDKECCPLGGLEPPEAAAFPCGLAGSALSDAHSVAEGTAPGVWAEVRSILGSYSSSLSSSGAATFEVSGKSCASCSVMDLLNRGKLLLIRAFRAPVLINVLAACLAAFFFLGLRQEL